jgi:hypothetical protein
MMLMKMIAKMLARLETLVAPVDRGPSEAELT